jgi:hypothetical protein
VLHIVEVLQATACPFALKERFFPQIMNDDWNVRAGDFNASAPRPSFGEWNGIYLTQQVETIRRAAESAYNTLFNQFRRPGNPRDLPFPEFFQAIEKTQRIGLCPFIEEIDVTGETGIAMKDYRLTANDQTEGLRSVWICFNWNMVN